MVDALRCAHRLLRPGGCVLDLHPTADIASVAVGSVTTGTVSAGDAPARHGAADAAIVTIVAEGLFVAARTLEFPFYTYADTIEELRDDIAENWCNARIDAAVVVRTREAMALAPGVRPGVREDVRATLLRRQPPLTAR